MQRAQDCNMNTKRGISISFLSILWLAAAALCADDPKDERFEKAEQWKMAAQNREMAAATQQDQAESLLQTAETSPPERGGAYSSGSINSRCAAWHRKLSRLSCHQSAPPSNRTAISTKGSGAIGRCPPSR